MKQRIPESATLRACLDLLAYEHIWHRRWNTGAIRNAAGRPVKFGQNGDADILVLPRIFIELMPHTANRYEFYPLWIECKSSRGKQSHSQELFQKEVEAAGHHYLLVRDIDQLRDWLREHGVIR